MTTPKNSVEDITEAVEWTQGILAMGPSSSLTHDDLKAIGVLYRAANELKELKERMARVEGSGLVIEKQTCDYDPMELRGQPIGQYHCPKCGTMVIAGAPHLEVDSQWNAAREAQILILADRLKVDGIEKTINSFYLFDCNCGPDAECTGQSVTFKDHNPPNYARRLAKSILTTIEGELNSEGRDEG